MSKIKSHSKTRRDFKFHIHTILDFTLSCSSD